MDRITRFLATVKTFFVGNSTVTETEAPTVETILWTVKGEVRILQVPQ